LIASTKLFITEEPPKSPDIATTQFITLPLSRPYTPNISNISPQKLPPPLPTDYQAFHFPSLPPDLQQVDPLPDSLYEKAHRKAERQEKQLRNIERERAQHEKVQLERIQDGLLGPDWLRVMGISGVTEGDRKKWDDAHEYFIHEVQCLLDKFRRWKEEERRRKIIEMKRKRGNTTDGDESESRAGTIAPGEDVEDESDGDVDALAAKQLHMETLTASNSFGNNNPPKQKFSSKQKSTSTSNSRHKLPSSPTQTTPQHTPSKRRPGRPRRSLSPVPLSAMELHHHQRIPTEPFTSFFSKPHQRAAALDKKRRTGRVRFAFGQPVPEPAEAAFELPASMVSEEARKASARLRRGIRRGRDG
jgi:hypothetical protein